MTLRHYIACDLGAESGRVILGTLVDGKLVLEEVHRFANGPVRVMGSLRWNLLGLFSEIKTGLRKVAERELPIAGVSVDTWGVDYAWFSASQPLLSMPYHYRDSRTQSHFASTASETGRANIFAETGIQFLPFNTLYQLLSDATDSPTLLDVADGFLNIADYFNYLLCGVPRAEVSLASTTQLYNPVTGDWSTTLLNKFGLRRELFPQIVPSATTLGSLLPEVQADTGLGDVQVIATCSHDTGAAVAAVPATGDDWAYLSSGTWSLIGVELPQPIINDAALAHNFTNEAGYGGTTRFLKNIIGLWLVQECRRAWQRTGMTLDYAELNQLAADAEPFRSLINPNAGRFLKPDDMPTAITDYCRETGQPTPETPGHFVRAILESLALLYAQTLDHLEQLTNRQLRRLHIVGGGSQSALLNQFAANATGLTVIAGPVEATAIGNLLIQAIALEQLDSLDSLRGVVRESFPVTYFEPQHSAEWENARDRFNSLELAI